MPKRVCALWGIMVLASACGGAGGLSKKEAIEQVDTIGELSSAVIVARETNADVLAPEGFAKVEEKLKRSLELAGDGKKGDAIVEAEEGLKLLDKITPMIERARELMGSVLATRERAEIAGAPNFYPDEWDEAEADFRETSMLIEEGKDVKAMEARAELMGVYSDLELRALKTGSKIEAQIAIQNAEKNDAEKWAPKTLKLAKEELKLVTSVLDSDRTQTQKAQDHAERASWLAGRAMAITQIAKTFEKNDYTPEEIVLWYQKQLSIINKPLNKEPPFNESNDVVVENLQQTLDSLYRALKDARKISRSNQKYIKKLEEKIVTQRLSYQDKIRELLSASRKELVALRKRYANELSDEARDRATAEERELDLKDRYQALKEVFDPGDATILLHDDNSILITLRSIYFSPGDAEIKSRNFALMNKIITALQYFPESKIIISGHTDSVGNEDKNLALSLLRAQNVERFLTEVGGVPAEQLESKGYGESKPVANNAKRSERAKNRRIEILITHNRGGN